MSIYSHSTVTQSSRSTTVGSCLSHRRNRASRSDMCRIRGLNSHNHNEKKLVPASSLRGSCVFFLHNGLSLQSESLVYINKLTSPFHSITNVISPGRVTPDLNKPWNRGPSRSLSDKSVALSAALASAVPCYPFGTHIACASK